MSRRKVEIRTCDRCDARQEVKEAHQGYEWAIIAAAEHNGPSAIGSFKPEGAKDICPACMRDLMRWWECGKTVAATEARA